MYRIVLLLTALCSAAIARAAPDAFITAYAREHRYSGTVLVAERGTISYEQSFGLANRAFGVPNTPDTVYKAASITKAFTAVLVLQLAEQRRLDLDAPFGDYLRAYRGNGARKVTLRQLLNHTSGLPNFDQVTDLKTALAQGIPNYQRPATSAQLLDGYCSGDLVAEPGARFDYNNCDYIVLGRVLEAASGQTFDALLRERLLEPLKLRHTGLLRQSAIVERLADTYLYREDLGALANDLPVYAENWYAAGSLYATARDLLAFSDALFDGRLLTAESLTAMTTPGLDDYGYGVWSYSMKLAGGAQRVVKRPGRIMGAQSLWFRLVDADVTLILLANTDAVDLDEFAAAIARKLELPAATAAPGT
ncbi:MAG TPA: serine hydrolase domain-containing protein [Tahibacter sp.]|uniref:serine hydrolase domain-containing protein n=1 Tax=Tahibacter sp. TaxID=2056211 RepID=UPI002B77EED3|nr:serine hydrolase domain-containing protein [Tahibacter sp.]HSX62524.1 serine hydrolase domain-containing protein [Tahibacter sp.]